MLESQNAAGIARKRGRSPLPLPPLPLPSSPPEPKRTQNAAAAACQRGYGLPAASTAGKQVSTLQAYQAAAPCKQSSGVGRAVRRVLSLLGVSFINCFFVPEASLVPAHDSTAAGAALERERESATDDRNESEGEAGGRERAQARRSSNREW